MIQTIVPRKPGRYASFPTFALDETRLVVCYREGECGNPATHGREGRVKRLVFDREQFSRALFSDALPRPAERTLFARDNEMDAIVTRMSDGVWTLATRVFSPPDNRMTTYMSFAEGPDFTTREEVRVPSVRWLVFFGKGFAHQGRYVFTAYGGLTGDTLYRPLLVATENGRDWELLAALPSPIDGVGLNECSLVGSGSDYHLFMRCDTKPFGIWHATSRDLQTWSRPRTLRAWAHAPMALLVNDRILLGYRDILARDRAAIALADPFDGPAMHLDRYEGNIYDGGYCDLGVLDGRLLVVYYLGNRDAEPLIRCRSMLIRG